MSGGGSFGYSNANSKSNSEYQNGSDFRQQVNPYQQGYLNNMMAQAQSTFAKYNKQFNKNVKSANANQGAIFDTAKSGLMNMLNGGAYTSPEGNQIRNHIMNQFNPAGMQAAATPNYQQFGIGNGTPVGMNPYLTGGSMEGKIPPMLQPPRPGIPPGFGGQPQRPPQTPPPGFGGQPQMPPQTPLQFQQAPMQLPPQNTGIYRTQVMPQQDLSRFQTMLQQQQMPAQISPEELARRRAMYGTF